MRRRSWRAAGCWFTGAAPGLSDLACRKAGDLGIELPSRSDAQAFAVPGVRQLKCVSSSLQPMVTKAQSLVY